MRSVVTFLCCFGVGLVVPRIYINVECKLCGPLSIVSRARSRVEYYSKARVEDYASSCHQRWYVPVPNHLKKHIDPNPVTFSRIYSQPLHQLNYAMSSIVGKVLVSLWEAHLFAVFFLFKTKTQVVKVISKSCPRVIASESGQFQSVAPAYL